MLFLQDLQSIYLLFGICPLNCSLMQKTLSCFFFNKYFSHFNFQNYFRHFFWDKVQFIISENFNCNVYVDLYIAFSGKISCPFLSYAIFSSKNMEHQIANSLWLLNFFLKYQNNSYFIWGYTTVKIVSIRRRELLKKFHWIRSFD